MVKVIEKRFEWVRLGTFVHLCLAAFVAIWSAQAFSKSVDQPRQEVVAGNYETTTSKTSWSYDPVAAGLSIHFHGELLQDNEGEMILKSLAPMEGRKLNSIDLSVESGGGLVDQVKLLSSGLRKFCVPAKGCEITTELQHGRICASSCVVLFMLGDVRRAHRFSFFGFHSYQRETHLRISSRRSLNFPFGKPIVQEVLDDYHEAGVSEAWLMENKAWFESTNLTYKKSSEIMKSNVVTEVFN